MSQNFEQNNFLNDELIGFINDESVLKDLLESEQTLENLADVFLPFDLLKSEKEQIENGENLDFSDEELPDINSRYRILVEQIPAIVFMSFLDKGINEAYISPQVETLLGFTQAEWLEDPIKWFEQLHEEDKTRWSLEAAQMFLTGKPLRSTYRVRARDGRIVWFHCEAKMVRRRDGRPWFIHGVAFDVSELKSKEAEVEEVLQALRHSEKLQRNIFEFAPDSMLVINHLGKIARVNSQVEKMFGYTPAEIIGKSILDLMPERFRMSHIIHQNNFMQNPHLREMGGGRELYALRKDESEFPVDIILSPIRTENETLVIAVIRDIERRKKNEEALKNYAEQQKIISRRLLEVQEAERRHLALELHDEIGQKLTGLKLTLEMIARQNEESDSIKLAQNLVNEVMAKVRKLSLDLRPATLDHLGLLSAFLWLIRNYTAQTNIEIDFNHTEIEGRRFSTEIETSAYRVVQEALTNIARHADVKTAKIRIWTDKSNLNLTIEDKGRGFDLEQILAEGNSTGVAGMRERVLFLNDDFQIETAPGKGTKISASWMIE
ncbi:MAG: PAS domain-containing sensor histidine kinase [Pyrinomonadaceae bacterium]